MKINVVKRRMREHELPSLDHSKEWTTLVSEEHYTNSNPKRGRGKSGLPYMPWKF
jgi:hypothetical protein